MPRDQWKPAVIKCTHRRRATHLVDTLEPALVADLDLEDVQVPVAADSGLDQLVPAALVAIGCWARG